jgi:hypothetical protein
LSKNALNKLHPIFIFSIKLQDCRIQQVFNFLIKLYQLFHEMFLVKKAFPELHGTVFGLFVLSFTKANWWPIFGPILQPNSVPYGGQFGVPPICDSHGNQF